MESRYPEYIIAKLRLNAGLSDCDTSRDKEFEILTPNEVFERVLEWEGLIRYDRLIRKHIKDIYGVELN